jgi:hypothetical protein
MARAETIALFEALGKEGLHVIVSSHVLHEVDRISEPIKQGCPSNGKSLCVKEVFDGGVQSSCSSRSNWS